VSRKGGLGRGLDALLPKAAEATRSLPITQLKPNRFQPRVEFVEDSLAELTESIRSQGVVQPIIVTPDADGGFMIVAGERRWRAAQRVGLQAVPVVVRQVNGEREMLELALVENLQRSDLNPVEEALAYRALADDHGLSQETISVQVGKARPTIANALRLLKLAQPVLDLLRNGRLTAGQARPLLALDSAREQVAVAEKAVANQLNARAIEALVRARVADRATQHAETADVHTAAAAEELTRRLQTRVDIKRRGNGGRLSIHFHSEDELMRLYDLLVTRTGAP
jgi:ParB family chromosome partitioning protein